MDTISSIQSGGGAVVPGTVQAARDFVGRDQTIHNNFGVGPRPASVDLATTLAHAPTVGWIRVGA